MGTPVSTDLSDGSDAEVALEGRIASGRIHTSFSPSVAFLRQYSLS